MRFACSYRLSSIIKKVGLTELYNLYSQNSVMVANILTGPPSVSLSGHSYRSMQDPLFWSLINHNQSNGSRECLSSPQPRYLLFLISVQSSSVDSPFFERDSSIGESHPLLPKCRLYQITDWRFSISITSWAKVMLIPIWACLQDRPGNHRTFHRKHDAWNCGERDCKTLLWFTKSNCI